MAQSSVHFPDLLQRLGKIADDVMNKVLPEVIEKAGDRILVYLTSTQTAYPQEGDWNRPGPYPKKWYQRGFGSRWALKGGQWKSISVGGSNKYIPAAPGGVHGTNNSEQMNERWRQEKTPTEIRTWNTASYADLVIGDSQTEYHREHGWRTAQSIADEFAGVAGEILAEEVVAYLEDL